MHLLATGTLPTVGDLTTGEILEQLLHAHILEVSAGRSPVRNAVFMGMGEPLNNYAAVVPAARCMTDVGYLGKYALPPGRVTISTVGVVANMRRLADDLPSVNLALSLHAPTQELRAEIVPAAKHNDISELLEIIDEHSARCKRPMIEYVLLAGVNDSDECAVALGKLMSPRSQSVMVNLIPYNPGASKESFGYSAPAHEVVERFQQIVAAFGVTTRVRKEMGKDIAGACGQLAFSKLASSTASTNSPAPDVEDDFIAWRRSRPKAEKLAIGAECVAVAAAAGASGRIVDLLLPEFEKQTAGKRLGLKRLLFDPSTVTAMVVVAVSVATLFCFSKSSKRLA